MKIKFKKSLMLTALSAFAVVGAVATPFAVTACGNGSSSSSSETPTESSLNAGLPSNWTQQDLEKAVSDYAESIKTKSDTELMQALNDLMKQLNDANTTAYDGIKDLATWTPLKENPTDPEHPSGGWTLNGNKNLNDIYNFFADKTSNNVFPTWEQITDPSRPGPTPPKLTPQEEANIRISIYMDAYPYVASEFAYAKMSAIVQQLANNKALDNESNIKTIATTLFIMSNNANKIYIHTEVQWKSEYMYNTLNKFVSVYKQIPFTITNADLEKQIKFWYNPDALPFDEKTGLAPFTIYTTTPSVVTPKTPTSPTA